MDAGGRLMVLDAEDAVWVCYSGGVVLRIRDGQVRMFTAADGLGWGILSTVRRRHRHQIERLEMQQATERERARIARDLHDEIGGSPTKIGKLATGLPDPAIAETTREVVLAMDQVVWTVNPRNDTLDSLATYLVHDTEEFLRPAGIACELDIPLTLPEVMLASAVRHNLFLATKEALNNAVKHGTPRRVGLGLTVDGGLLTLTVRDDGCGFSPATTAAGADGLGNMRDRLAAIGGELHITPGMPLPASTTPSNTVPIWQHGIRSPPPMMAAAPRMPTACKPSPSRSPTRRWTASSSSGCERSEDAEKELSVVRDCGEEPRHRAQAPQTTDNRQPATSSHPFPELMGFSPESRGVAGAHWRPCTCILKFPDPGGMDLRPRPPTSDLRPPTSDLRPPACRYFYDKTGS